MNYTYRGLNEIGKSIRGDIEAKDEPSAKQILKEKGVYVIEIKESKVQKVTKEKPKAQQFTKKKNSLASCKDCGNNISKKASSCPNCGAPVKKSTSRITLIAALFLLSGIAWSFKTSPEQKNLSITNKRSISDPASQIAWIKEKESYCSRYEKAPNEIKASAIFREFQSEYKASQTRAVNSSRGVLHSLSTDHGGDDVYIKIKVGDYVFHDQDTNKGEKVYNQATSLVEGQCIYFSGTYKVLGLTERGQVCSSDFVGKLSDIKTCN